MSASETLVGMRLTLLVISLVATCLLSSVCTALVCLHALSVSGNRSASAQPVDSETRLTMAARTAPRPAASVAADSDAEQGRSTATAVDTQATSAPPQPPPPLDEVIPPPPVQPQLMAHEQLTALPAPPTRPQVAPAAPVAPVAADAPPEPVVEGEPPPLVLQHLVEESIYRDYFLCTQAEVVVINTYQRCYQLRHEDLLVIGLIARYAGVPLSVVFRTFYDDDHGNIQALLVSYHLDPEIFFIDIPLTIILPIPYQRPYHLFRNHHQGWETMSNDEYRALIALKIACEFQDRTADQFFTAMRSVAAPPLALFQSTGTPVAERGRTWLGSAVKTPVPGVATTRHTAEATAAPLKWQPVPATATTVGEPAGVAEAPARAASDHDQAVGSEDRPRLGWHGAPTSANGADHVTAPEHPGTTSGQHRDSGSQAVAATLRTHDDSAAATPAYSAPAAAQQPAPSPAPAPSHRNGF